MRYVGNELLYIINNKRILLCVIGLLFVNTICFYMYLESDKVNPKQYKSYCEQVINNQKDVTALLAENVESNECNEIFEEYQLMLSYSDFLKKIKNEADENKGITLFQNDYSQRLIQKTENDYEKLHNLNIEFCGSYGACSFLKYSGSYIIIAIIAVILVIELIIRDKKNLLFNLYKSTQNGDWKIIISKYAAFMIVLFVFWSIIYLINYVLMIYSYGTIRLDLPVQCLKDYYQVGHQITIAQLFIKHYANVLIFMSMMTAVLFFVAICSSNEALLLMKTAGIIAVAILGANISIKLGFSFGYDFLSASLMKPYYYFQYRNYNIASYPINAGIVTIISCIVVAVLFIFFTCIYFENNEMYYKSINTKGIFAKQRRKRTNSLLGLETIKLLFGYKIIFVLLLLLGVQLYVYSHKDVRWTNSDISYKYYMNQIEGPITDEKIEFLNTEEQKYIALTKACDELDQKMMDGDISEKYYNDQYKDLIKEMEKQDGFYKCLEYAQCVMERNNKNDTKHPIGFVYDRGYNCLFGIRSKNQVLNVIFLCLICFIIIPYIYAEDYKDNMNMLLETTARVNVLKRRKLFLALSSGLIVYMGIYLTEVLWVSNTFGINHLNYSIQSLSPLGKFPFDLSILEYIALVSVLRMAILGIALTIEVLIGKIIKNTYLCIMIFFVVIVIPLLLLYMDISIFGGYIVNRILVGNLA